MLRVASTTGAPVYVLLTRVLSLRYVTVTITRIGTTQKYADGWDKAFGTKKRRSRAQAAPRAAKKSGGSKKTTRKKTRS